MKKTTNKFNYIQNLKHLYDTIKKAKICTIYVNFEKVLETHVMLKLNF